MKKAVIIFCLLAILALASGDWLIKVRCFQSSLIGYRNGNCAQVTSEGASAVYVKITCDKNEAAASVYQCADDQCSDCVLNSKYPIGGCYECSKNEPDLSKYLNGSAYWTRNFYYKSCGGTPIYGGATPLKQCDNGNIYTCDDGQLTTYLMENNNCSGMVESTTWEKIDTCSIDQNIVTDIKCYPAQN